MHIKPLLQWTFTTLSFAYAGMLLTLSVPGGNTMTALLPPGGAKPQEKWQTITEVQVESGTTVPAATNVIFHIPSDITRITRQVLLGQKGKTVRYWGYCFPDNYDPASVAPLTLPGKVFLSEAERKWRDAQLALSKPMYSIYQPPLRQPAPAFPVLRHQIENFTGGMTCYIMTEQVLPMGIDTDGDELNSELERQHKTDPDKSDTDGDGLSDGVEVIALGTNPGTRDSDGDGLLDGIEDHNRNGRLDPGEPDPRKYDSDNDTLCDGYCKVFSSKRICSDLLGRDCVTLPYARWSGEDKNLNGVLDTGETDPTKIDTDGDGILDDQEYYKCMLDKKTNC